MSTSGSIATSSAIGQCVVCGRESTKGCSKCKAAGLDWMYFCSVEHQRLIWKTHKLVCGKNPFAYPALSEAEVEEMWKHRHEPSLISPSLIETLQQCFQTPSPPNSWTAGGDLNGDLLDSFFQLELRVITRQEHLQLFRGIAFGTKLRMVGKAEDGVSSVDTRSLLAQDPLGFLAMMSYSVPGVTYSSDCWLRKFQHRLFILIGTLKAKEDNGNYADRDIAWTATRVIKFAGDTVGEVDSESARFLHEKFVPFLLRAIGLEIDVSPPEES
ncbi:hypothetical protein JCM3765_006491 [Sporobolomyces pararoseus]